MVKQSKDDQAKKANGDTPPRPAEAPAGTPHPQGPGASARTGAGTEAQLTVLAQYVKDLSFESPGAPQTLQGPGENPQLQVGVNVSARPRAARTSTRSRSTSRPTPSPIQA